MSFDLSFFALHHDTDRNKIINAHHNILSFKSVTWHSNSAFDAFYEELKANLRGLGCEHFITQPTLPGIVRVSLSGELHSEAHQMIGGLLMLHEVICYDPQNGEITLELEPF